MLVISLATEQGFLSWLLFQPLSQAQNHKGSKQTADEGPRTGLPGRCSPCVPLMPHRRHLENPHCPPTPTKGHKRGQDADP